MGAFAPRVALYIAGIASCVVPYVPGYNQMAFLDNVERVLYEKNPLESVICQVRFPTILRVDSEVPSDFQDRIRGRFPIFSESSDESSLFRRR
jgi:hypothetical protein